MFLDFELQFHLGLLVRLLNISKIVPEDLSNVKISLRISHFAAGLQPANRRCEPGDQGVHQKCHVWYMI